MIPRFRPMLGAAELKAVLHVARSDDVERFESRFANAVGQRHAVAFPYGRTGLLALLSALGIRQREIICPAYTCVVVPHAIVTAVNRPLFVDSQHDANMDLGLAEQALSPNTAALVATSIFGNPVNLDHLAKITARHPSLIVIQDCAHSFNAKWRGRPVNVESTAAIFGLNASKTMTSIFGGMVTTDSDLLAESVRRERSLLVKPSSLRKSMARLLYMAAISAAFCPPVFGLTEVLRRAGLLDRFVRYYNEAEIDMPPDYAVALTCAEARVGAVQVERLESFIAARRRYAAFYQNALTDVEGLTWIAAEGSTYSHIAAQVANRDLVVNRAAAQGVQLGTVIDYSVPEMSAYRRMAQGTFPVAHSLARRTINLPTSGRFDERLATRVVSVMKGILRDQPPVSLA